jgi:hypothetical protein
MAEDKVKSMMGPLNTFNKLKELKDAVKYLPVVKAADKLKADMPIEDYLKGVVELVHEVAKVQGISYKDMKIGQMLDLCYDLVVTDSRVRKHAVDLLKPLVK